MEVCMLVIQDRWLMYKVIRDKLNKLKDRELIAIIDEGRSRKRREKCRIKNIYGRIFTIEIDDKVLSFSYSDLICETIILKLVWLFYFLCYNLNRWRIWKKDLH